MTGPTKRTAEDEPTPRRTRSAKVAKTEGTSPRKGGKKGPKTSLGASSFKNRALPLHVNITHTPPAVTDGEGANATSADPGFIGTTALIPTIFNTGSYGWKGNKRVTIEVPNGESGGEKEKVHVMLTINATVMGSKNAKDDDGAEGENAEHPEAADAEAATEKPDGEPAAAPAAEESKGEEATKDVEMATEDQKEEEEEEEKDKEKEKAE